MSYFACLNMKKSWFSFCLYSHFVSVSWVLNLYWTFNCWGLWRQARPCSCSKQTPDSLHLPHTPNEKQQQQIALSHSPHKAGCWTSCSFSEAISSLPRAHSVITLRQFFSSSCTSPLCCGCRNPLLSSQRLAPAALGFHPNASAGLSLLVCCHM